MDRSENMRAIRSKDTKPERAVRSLVHKLGYRFRLHRKGLPGKPDLVFPGRHKVVFVHGCFWHSHNCKAGLIPKTNSDFWSAKLHRNQVRDRDNFDALRLLGWEVLAIWQCELTDVHRVTRRVKTFLGKPGRQK